jgi:hypothetical protein
MVEDVLVYFNPAMVYQLKHKTEVGLGLSSAFKTTHLLVLIFSGNLKEMTHVMLDFFPFLPLIALLLLFLGFDH